MTTDTTNFGFTRPSPGEGNWGTTLNSCIQEIDTLLATSIDTDGTLKAGAVDATEVLADSVVTAGKIANRTRQFLVQAVGGYNITDSTALIRDNSEPSRWCWPLYNSKLSYVVGNFRVPSDFVSNLSVKFVLLGPIGFSGNAFLAAAIYYGAAGEIYSQHSASLTEGTYTIQASMIHEVGEVSLSDAAAGDYVLLSFYRNATQSEDTLEATLGFIGFLVSYTADS